MKRLAWRDRTNPTIEGLADLPWRQIFRWLKTFHRERQEIGAYGAPEEIKAPIVTIDLKSGDCDDFTTLATAIALAKGEPIAWGFTGRNGKATHVWPIVNPRGRWINLDPFRSYDAPVFRPYTAKRIV